VGVTQGAQSPPRQCVVHIQKQAQRKTLCLKLGYGQVNKLNRRKEGNGGRKNNKIGLNTTSENWNNRTKKQLRDKEARVTAKCGARISARDLLITLMMQAVSTFETSFNLYETIRHNIPKGYHLHTRRRGNLNPHMYFYLLP
jgi:hypothetical protein